MAILMFASLIVPTTGFAQDLPDLIITDVTMEPQNPVAGDQVIFKAVLKNQGTAATPDGTIHALTLFSDWNPLNANTDQRTSLAPGASVELVISWTATAGKQLISVMLDDVNRISESDEGNNIYSFDVTVGEGTGGEEPGSLPDLALKELTWIPQNPVAGDQVTFKAVLKNQGTVATPDGVIHSITIFKDWAPITFSSNHTASIAPGETVELVFPVWTAVAGSHSMVSWIDDAKRIEENDKDNNYYYFNLSVKEESGENPPELDNSTETLLGDRAAEGFFDNAGYNMGTIFIPKTAGIIKGIRLFGVVGEIGDHTAYIYDVANRTIIAGPYTINYNGSNSWIEYPLETPINVAANKEYMVMVSTGEDSQGHYASINSLFSEAGDNGDSLAWPQNAGRFGAKTTEMPSQSWGNSSYMRDVIFVSTEIPPGVAAVNGAGTDPVAVKAALESSQLNMELMVYNFLLEEEKNQVVAGVIAQKPESGYSKRSQIQAVVDSIAIPIYEESIGMLVKKINDASTISEIREALILPELELNLLTYNALSYAQKNAVAQAILNGKPEEGYKNKVGIQNIIDTEVSKLLALPSSKDIPELHEEFLPWEGAVSPNAIWQKAGPWKGTLENMFEVERAITQETYNGEDGGFLILKSLADSKNGAEIQTLTSYGYGYYETRMKPTSAYGVCNSFFWIESTSGYGPHEWDVEFFTVKDNIVDYTIHPHIAGRNYSYSPDYTYSDDFHRYGFLWTPGRIDYTIDGEIVKTFIDDILYTDAKGHIMMNSWTEYTWLDGPPATDAEVAYDWVKFYPLNEVDKAALEEAIKAAKDLNAFHYTEESWQSMQEALNAAIDMDSSIYSTQDQIITTTTGLLARLDELEIVEVSLPAESMFYDWSNVESLKTDNWECNYGIMFSTAAPGRITHIRVFGLEGETGNHTAYIWENESSKIIGGPYTINYTGSNEWVEYKLPEPIDIPEAEKIFTVVVTTGDTGLVPIEREGTAHAGNNGASIYRPIQAGVFGPKGTNRPTVSWRYNYLRDVIFVPYAENPVVVEVNSADDLAGIRVAMEKYPQWLDITQYNRLNEGDKNSIAQVLLDRKSEGYGKVQDIQQIMNTNAEIFVNAEIEAAVALVNSSSNEEELAQAIVSPFLELQLDLFETLTEEQKSTVLENMLQARPVKGYAGINEIKEFLSTEVKDLLYRQIAPWDPNFFPIGVWMQNPSPSVMEQYKSIGVNTYVSLSSGGLNESLYNTLKEYDMKAITGQNRYARENMDKAEEVILAWLQEDEPDIARFTPDWWPLPPITPEEIHKRYTEFKKYNQTIPVYMNLSQGVANPSWTGRGVDSFYTYMYPEYAKGADILSFDIYCVNDGYDLSYIAKGVENLYNYSDGKQPVWAFVETTKFNEGNVGRPAPEQVKAQVWIALVHGAKGIEYFCHQFSPEFVEAGPLHEDYADIKEMMASINAQVTELAPVLNSPDTSGFASVESSNSEVTVDFITKEYEGAQYIFSVGMQADSTTATFHIDGGGFVEVLGENRIIEVSDGKFSDKFEPHGVHLYRVRSMDEISTIIQGAYSAGHIKNDGILNSLMTKIGEAEKYSLESYANKKLYNALQALSNQVRAQSGKHIDAEFAQQLLDRIKQFMDIAADK